MSNPILDSSFNQNSGHYSYQQTAPMTMNGVISKLSLMAVLMVLSGGATWYQFSIGNLDKVNTLMMGGLIVGFIAVLVASFIKKTMPFAVPIYAFAEGAFLAGTSCYFEATLPGVVIQAVALTFITLFTMIFLYATRVIKVTEKFRSVVFSMTFAVMIFYLIAFVLSLFHINIPLLVSNSPLSIGVSVFMCGLASVNLLIDFDFIENATRNFFPKEYEWTATLGLLTTIVWLYIEILRLLSKLRKN